jgi:stress response protein SCP2
MVSTQYAIFLGTKVVYIFTQVDLDCSALVFDDCGVLVDACFYNHLEACSGALVHSGDNRDGLSDGVDERITLFLSKFPGNLSFVVFAVNAFQGGALADVETASAAFLNGRGETLTTISATCSASASEEKKCILLCMLQASARPCPRLRAPNRLTPTARRRGGGCGAGSGRTRRVGACATWGR